ncbi:hypothetical protein EI94DRAFT_407292 [Lactarius quietus]|nr:hypothetical protein EI94DRAFT_407292 [Lactarius quietus]
MVQGQASASQWFRGDNQRFVNGISLVPDVLYTFSHAFGLVLHGNPVCNDWDAPSLYRAGVPPAGVIFTGIGVFLAASMDVRTSHESRVRVLP